MIKFLAFLLILIILFGLEATRAIIFGSFGFIFFIIAGIILIGLIISFIESAKPGEDKPEPKSEPVDYTSHKKALLFWLKAIIIISLLVVALVYIPSLLK